MIVVRSGLRRSIFANSQRALIPSTADAVIWRSVCGKAQALNQRQKRQTAPWGRQTRLYWLIPRRFRLGRSYGATRTVVQKAYPQVVGACAGAQS